MKKCPYCAEEIKEEARKCRFCGSPLDQELKEEEEQPKEGLYLRVSNTETKIKLFILYSFIAFVVILIIVATFQ